MESNYFPERYDDAFTYLGTGPLRKPRASLVRNLVIVLAKKLIDDATPYYRHRWRLAAALSAVRRLHPEQYSNALREKLTTLFRSIEDARLEQALLFLDRTTDSWQYLERDVQHRLRNFVASLSVEQLDTFPFLFEMSPLNVEAEKRIASLPSDELMKFSGFLALPKVVADKMVSAYLESVTFAQANAWSKCIRLQAAELTYDHVHKILTTVSQNSQLVGSFQLGAVIRRLRECRKLPGDTFERLLVEHGLAEYASTEDTPEMEPKDKGDLS